jgi:hypothetical protein
MTEILFQHLIEHVALEVLGVALKPHLKAFYRQVIDDCLETLEQKN